MIRMLVAVAVMTFATTAQAGIYRCTITRSMDGLRAEARRVLEGLTKQFNPIVLNTETGFVRFGRGGAGHQWTVSQSGEAFGEQQASGDWVFVGPTTANEIIRCPMQLLGLAIATIAVVMISGVRKRQIPQ
jgi:hypothetical protein